jgi:hypothetical protein
MEYILLNGIKQFQFNSDKFTSFQPRGCAVVDYVIANANGKMLVSKFIVLNPKKEWTDHAALAVELNIKIELPICSL